MESGLTNSGINHEKKKVVTFGEIMLRLSTPGFQRFLQARMLEITFGRSEANVAVSLANFGEKVEFVNVCLTMNYRLPV
jgi:hypothetical protein